MTLLEAAELFVKTIEYEIAKSRRKGDEESARLKTLTLNLVNDAIRQHKESK